MRFDIGDGRGINPGARVNRAQQGLLSVRVRCRDTVAAAVLVGAAGFDDGVDTITVGQRLGERFQDQRGRGFSHRDAVGGCVEGMAASVG